MDNKNLKAQTAESGNCLTRQDVPTEMVELSEKDLQQIIGGREELAPPSSCFACASPCSNSSSLVS
jgi:bacteriocin-like protein